MPGYGLSCKVSGIEAIMKSKAVKDKNKRNLTVKVDGVVIDESSDIDPTSVISGSDNGEQQLIFNDFDVLEVHLLIHPSPSTQNPVMNYEPSHVSLWEAR